MSDYYFWTWQARLDDAQANARKAHFTSIRARLRLQDRVARLEDDVLHANLAVSALADLCVEKGLATADELMDRIARRAAAHAAQPVPPAPAKPRRRRTRSGPRG